MRRDLTVISEEPQEIKRKDLVLLCIGELKLAFVRGKMSWCFCISQQLTNGSVSNFGARENEVHRNQVVFLVVNYVLCDSFKTSNNGGNPPVFIQLNQIFNQEWLLLIKNKIAVSLCRDCK